MADTSHSESSSMGTGQDMKAHAGGYSLFIALFKWASIVAAVVTAIVVVLIAS